ncbi:efflux RND transporter periplasmic adaptor subunit [Rhodobacter sp. Har01]|uniref:efflux RND transporter periplasmic adaptor subunit n=1 Tax=Rhodobacter sp. Har01 TaxID=2883999 RepID=UPI001D065D87|nr:efflux RND transporter periplasmic adaptor subunit [Rhodobacter sp. Har01]MCB6177097.1 efflux RND transporter periplasmic adaptor subunit [Rhodobacter sp. Har01]
MRLRPLALAAVLALVAAAPLPALAEASTEDPAAAASGAASLPAITVSTAGVRRLSDRIIASGLIAPIEEVQVQPLIEGQPIEALLADVGDEVTEGQVLARLSRSTLELQRAQSVAAVEAAKATIAQGEAQLLDAESASAEAARVAERARKLREQGSASQAALDTANAASVSATARVSVARQSLAAARAQLSLSEAQLANVELQLTRTDVKAPYAGRITDRNATIGAIATAAGTPMFVLEKDGALELRVDVAETDILRLAQGQKAVLRAVGLASPLTGTVRLVEPSIDATTRLGRARLSVDAFAGLRAGMFVEAEILVTEHDALAVPVTSVGSENGAATVMRVTDGIVERVVVQTGIRDGGFVEILSGLAPGDKVVTKAGSFVRNGDRIAPVAAPATN